MISARAGGRRDHLRGRAHLLRGAPRSASTRRASASRRASSGASGSPRVVLVSISCLAVEAGSCHASFHDMGVLRRSRRRPAPRTPAGRPALARAIERHPWPPRVPRAGVRPRPLHEPLAGRLRALHREPRRGFLSLSQGVHPADHRRDDRGAGLSATAGTSTGSVPALLGLAISGAGEVRGHVRETMILVGAVACSSASRPLNGRTSRAAAHRLFFCVDYALLRLEPRPWAASLPGGDIVVHGLRLYPLPTLLAVKISQKSGAPLVLPPRWNQHSWVRRRLAGRLRGHLFRSQRGGRAANAAPQARDDAGGHRRRPPPPRSG